MLNERLCAFVTAFVASGVFWGVTVILLLRAFRKDLTSVEDELKDFRKKLDERTVPIVPLAIHAVRGALIVVYGRSALRRLCSSALIAFGVTAFVMTFFFGHYRHVAPRLRSTKMEVERSAGRSLYEYHKDPLYADAWERVFEPSSEHIGRSRRPVLVHPGPKFHWDWQSMATRERCDRYDRALLDALSKHPDREDLALLFVFEGHYLKPGFRLSAFLTLLLFNVLIDFALASGVFLAVRWVARRPVFTRLLTVTVPMICVTGLGFYVSLASCYMFYHGNRDVFSQLVITTPKHLYFWVMGVGMLIVPPLALVFDRKGWKEILLPSLFWGSMYVCWGIWGLTDLWKIWAPIASGLVLWRTIPIPVYVLAATAFVPAGLCLTAVVATVTLKVVAEPLRLVLWGYMTWVVEVRQKSHLWGIIALLTTITSGLIALLAVKGQ